jgi:peroxiredoxin
VIRTLTAAALALGFAVVGWADPRPVSPFEVTTFDGRQVSLDDLKGRPFVLMFLSTDCPHCQETTQRIGPVYRQLQPQGLQILGLSLNRIDNAGLRDYAARFGASHPLALSSREEFSRITKISVMRPIYYPYVLFVDSDGVIQEEHQGSEEAWFANLESNFLAALSRLR